METTLKLDKETFTEINWSIEPIPELKEHTIKVWKARNSTTLFVVMVFKKNERTLGESGLTIGQIDDLILTALQKEHVITDKNNWVAANNEDFAKEYRERCAALGIEKVVTAVFHVNDQLIRF